MEARTLDSPGRAALADYLCVVMGGENNAKKVHLSGDSLHSSVKRAHKIVSEYFDEILKDQEFLATTEQVKKFVSMIPDDNLAALIEKNLEKLPPDSQIRWNDFLRAYTIYWKESGNMRRLKYLVEEIQLQFCYPRLDVNVTKGSNHLLKSPFSIHPKTGKICVVFRAAQVRQFNLEEVPSLQVLLDENAAEHSQHKAAMQAAVKAFQEHVFALEKDEARRKRTTDTSIDF